MLLHPSYTGLPLVFAGGGVMVGNWLGATAGVVLLLVALGYRSRTEERALSATLGDRYRAFAAGRARLVPFLWSPPPHVVAPGRSRHRPAGLLPGPSAIAA